MLFNNNSQYVKDEIVAFKMVNGDEIVAKVVESSMTGWTVNKPCTVIPSAQGIGLVQSLFTGDINKNVELRADHVMLHTTVIKEMESHYIQTTTGIQTVTKGSIIK
jgi:hypothetical protein